MSVKNYSIVVKNLQLFAENHREIQRFKSTYLDKIETFASEDRIFPILYVTPSSITNKRYTNSYAFDVICLDKLNTNKDNEEAILTETELILRDLSIWLKESENGLELRNEPVLVPLQSYLMDGMCGWQAKYEVEGPVFSSECSIPFLEDFLLNPSEINCDIQFIKNYLTCDTLSGCSAFVLGLNSKVDKVEGYGLSANDFTDELYNLLISLSGGTTIDTYITGGTYSNGITTLTNNQGNSISIDGYYTGYTLTNVGIITALGYTPLSAASDTNVYTTGGTYSNGVLTFITNSGTTYSVAGLSTGYTLTAPAITSTLGYTPLSAASDTSIYNTNGTITDSTRIVTLSDMLSFSGTADAKINMIGSLGVGQSATTHGQYTFSTGFDTNAFGKYSLASGYQTTAKHTASASFGRGTISTTNEQLVVGKFNTTGNTAAQYLLIGNGTGDTARNDLAWFSSSGITLGDTNTSVNEGDSYAINFQGHGTAGVSQSASIFLDGGGGSSSTAGLKISSSGFIQLIPSNPEVLISGSNPLVYTLSGFRLLANSTTAGITIGNGYPQTTGDLFTVINSATNSLLTVAAATGNVVIGSSSTADIPTAQLNLTSTSKGILLPRLTTTQRDAISTPASQLLISNTTKKTLDQYNGTSWNSIAGDYCRDLLAIQALGSPIKAGPLIWFLPQSGAGLVSSRTYFNAIYVEKEITISGAAFIQTVQGVYTGSSYNGIGLYSYSNGVVTLIDSTANDTEFWKTSTTSTGTWVQKAFSGGTRTLQPGIYFLCALYSSSAQTTAPSIGASSWTANNAFAPLTTNSSRLYGGVITSVTALPATQSCSAWNNVSFYFGLYLY